MATKYIEEDKRDSIIPWLSGAQQNSFISSTPDNRSLFGLLIRGTHEGRSSSFVHHHTAGNLLFPPKTIPSCIIHYYIQTGTRLPRHLLSYYYLGNWLALLGLKSPKEPAARRKKKRLDCLAQFPLDIWYSSSVLSSCFLSLSSSTGRQFSTIKGKVPEALFSPFFFWCPPFLTDCVLLAWDWLTVCLAIVYIWTAAADVSAVPESSSPPSDWYPLCIYVDFDRLALIFLPLLSSSFSTAPAHGGKKEKIQLPSAWLLAELLLNMEELSGRNHFPNPLSLPPSFLYATDDRPVRGHSTVGSVSFRSSRRPTVKFKIEEQKKEKKIPRAKMDNRVWRDGLIWWIRFGCGVSIRPAWFKYVYGDGWRDGLDVTRQRLQSEEFE